VSARRQSADIGERVSLALRDALFERGRNIADPNVLRDIAASCGVQERLGEVDEVIADWRDGERRGVIGSPHFFGASGNWFCPTLTITHLDGELRMADNGEGLDRFAAACLSG
jgi:2-hydroxychromene-2-carboxylate isomerase